MSPLELPRRDLLKAGLAWPLLAGLPGAAALSRAADGALSLPDDDGRDRLLVIVQLSGGLDGLSTVVPYADDDYQRARPVLGLGPGRVEALDDRLGLARPCAALLEPWDAGQLAIVQGVGCPEPNRSHFLSLDIWHTARLDGRTGEGGWLGRLATRLAGDEARLPVLRVGERSLPLALAGGSPQVPAVELFSDLELGDDVDLSLLEELAEVRDGRGAAAREVARIQRAALACAERLAAARSRQRAAGGAFRGRLGRALRTAAQLLDAGLGTRVLYLTQGGYDTHARQAEDLPGLQREFCDSLVAFWSLVQRQGAGDRVAVMAFSEFGRRLHENGSGGTDHGAGNPLFLLGGGVTGGLHGEAPRLDLPVDGDVPVTLDFRRVYADLLTWLGQDPAAVLPEPLPALGLLA